ncbi:target of rapamycin complex 2 subunit MAPKAP1 [Fopius arisanus]|uniref:Sin1_1 protein n=1 Tax=Fopius arisanus TaxID=64838 RepID=A0A0C9QPP2_9HYME|nr:PREDICTED: target of rapamycin complex 2 subunit MAPKAP1 [Fopius arisanus]
MALYDNKHWLLSHIRDSFISTDDTGMCELVMLGEDIPKQLKADGEPCYPGDEESDDEDLDAMSESYDIQMDMEFGHRPRSNTAQRLEKMEMERKKAAKIKHIKWEPNPINMNEEEKFEMFKRKDLRKQNEITKPKRQSLLSEQLVKSPLLPRNPFTEYIKFDGNAQIGVHIRKYRIYMCMLSDEERRYPLQIVVLGTAKVQEFIGLICYKYASEHPNHNLKEDITKYGLYITEDDGEVDWDFPCLDPREVISKFEFPSLCLVEMRACDRARHDPIDPIRIADEESPATSKMEQEIFAEDLARMKGHTTAMEAPLYQLYRVHIINKVRAKTEIHLGISGDKIEIDPVITGKGASRFWHRQRAVSYQMDNIAWCELTETKGSKTTFTLIYTHQSISDTLLLSSTHSHSLNQSTSFKTHDFEADASVAEEIVRKINHILELRSSNARKEFLQHRERKAARRKSFSLHR